MQIKLRYVVIVVPAFAAIIISIVVNTVRNAVREREDAAIAAYKAGRDESPWMMLSTFGSDECGRRMISLAGSTSGVLFDGKDRWVKILNRPHPAAPKFGDGLLLFSLADGSTQYAFLPAGGVVTDIAFSDNCLIVQACGYFDHGSSAYSVPKDSPIEIRLNWQPGAVPYSETFGKRAIREYMLRYRVK